MSVHNRNPRKKNTRKRRKNPVYGSDWKPILEMIFESGIFDGSFTGFEPHQRETPNPVPDLTTMWRKIMMLCHPDKHNNSELSVEVTRWLIENRPN